MSNFTFNMKERASFARDLEYIKEDMDEYGLKDQFNNIDRQSEDKEDYIDCKQAIDQISPIDDTKETELRRLLNSEKDMSFEKMIGAVNDIDDKQNLPIGSECDGSCGGSGCDDCDSHDPTKLEDEDKKQLNLKDVKNELGALSNTANQQVEESAEEKYIDILIESAEYLDSIAELYDQETGAGNMMRHLVIESVFDTDDSVILMIKKDLKWFDGEQVVINYNKSTGDVTTRL